MKLKETIPNYQVGDTVTILDNLELRHIRDRDSTINSEMLNYQSNTYTITHNHLDGLSYNLLRGGGWSWSYNMFKESYVDETKETEESPIIPYIGMYLYHDDHLAGKSDDPILFKVDSVDPQRNSFHTVYIRPFHRLPKTNITEYVLNKFIETPQSYLHSELNIDIIDNRTYLTNHLFLPDNDLLMKQWGVSNKVFKPEKVKAGMLPIPNFFEKFKYPLKQITFKNKKGFHKKVGFSVNKKIMLEIINNKFIKHDVTETFGTAKVEQKDLKSLICNSGKAIIKSYDNSVSIFGHKTRKKAMFEAFIEGSELKYNKPKQWTINSVIFNYEKDNKFYHVLELNDGTLNLKFLLDDLQLILPNVNSYVEPKDRTIKSNDTCILVNDKLSPLQRGSKVKVVKMFNRHQPDKYKTYDKNTICVVQGNNKQTFECKVKQLKKV